MDEPTRSVFAAFVIVYLTLFALYEVMVLRVNRHLSSNNVVSLMPLRQWRRLMCEHTRLFPKSALRAVLVSTLAVFLSLSVVLVTVQIWSYFHQ
jgi:hypothetical protein